MHIEAQLDLLTLIRISGVCEEISCLKGSKCNSVGGLRLRVEAVNYIGKSDMELEAYGRQSFEDQPSVMML
ncbi:hypothetical protein DEO72_LG2g3572 [Vigna unguiculata]|uniref:Uncharacterized protein n=1 Tax=Vigna unguiculata TaxID=3917 RepID=A0A4D6L402_VIGUN|nr:hypothetical protein DEO72_LG2g3572 [Vigna unguiculata]